MAKIRSDFIQILNVLFLAIYFLTISLKFPCKLSGESNILFTKAGNETRVIGVINLVASRRNTEIDIQENIIRKYSKKIQGINKGRTK